MLFSMSSRSADTTGFSHVQLQLQPTALVCHDFAQFRLPARGNPT